VTLRRWVAPLALVVTVAAGCGPATPDYQSIWSTSATTTTPTSTEDPVPLSAYLDNIGVTGAPVAPDKLTDLTVSVPTPPGWAPYTNPNFAPGTRVIAKGATYPTAMLLVFQLDGDFDVKDVLKHADGDAELSENFTRLNGSADNYRGFPSSMVEGTYDLNGQRMQSYNRVVIATGTPVRANLPGQQYLIQLTLTSFADQAAAQGPDIEAILRGFVVKAK
jgi:hypothetical protein